MRLLQIKAHVKTLAPKGDIAQCDNKRDSFLYHCELD